MNKIERLKVQLKPHLFESRLKDLDWKSLSEADRFYLKNYGIYNIKLRPENFMIRVRFDGADVPSHTLDAILKLSKEFKLSIIITARGGLELHNITPENVYTIYSRLQKEKIDSRGTLTDNFRTITTDPFGDIAKDSLIDTVTVAQEIRNTILNSKEFFGLIPRKFNTAIVGRVNPIGNFWANDALFAIAKKGNELGFNLYLGGRNSQVAKSINMFIYQKDTLKLFLSVARVYSRLCERGSRAKIRLFHLIENLGMERVKSEIEEEFGSRIETEGELLVDVPKEIDSLELKDGYFGYRVVSQYGELSIDRLEEIVSLSKQNNIRIRFGIDQNIYIVSKGRLSVKTESETLNIISCVGSRYCPLSLWDIKKDIEYLPTDRLKRLNIKVGFSGCLKGCGRHYHSDIGLIGLRTNLYAPTEKAFRVFLGTTYSREDIKPARMLYYSVPKRVMNSLINTILDDFEMSGYPSFMRFSQNVLSNYSIQFLQLWYIAKEVFKLGRDDIKLFLSVDEVKVLNRLRDFIDIEDSGDLSENIKELSHKLWDLKS